MDKLAAGLMIALAALLMSGGFARDVMAAEVSSRESIQLSTSQSPVLNGHRSGLVVSLVLTLEALRAAPAVLNDRKV